MYFKTTNKAILEELRKKYPIETAPEVPTGDVKVDGVMILGKVPIESYRVNSRRKAPRRQSSKVSLQVDSDGIDDSFIRVEAKE